MAEFNFIPLPPRGEDLTGRRFGRLVVLDYYGAAKRQLLWLCHCDCGNQFVAVGGRLRQGATSSCGCARHGHAGTRLYRIWQGIKTRCFNANEPAYHRYGGRGIVTCKRWRDSFEAFLADMGQPPTMSHSIDRVENDGHYSCGCCEECEANGWTANCRWATKREQTANRWNTLKLTHEGTTLTVREWSERTGLSCGTIYHRHYAGWDVGRVLTTPWSGSARNKREKISITHNGECLSIREWSERTGLRHATIRFRYLQGWAPEKILATPADPRRLPKNKR